MSVLVKGMRMPESCGTCIMRDGLFCMASDYKRISYGSMHNGSMLRREEWCPLVALPDKHGDLIDRDEAYDCIAEQEGGNYVDMDTVGKGLECTPTIVESEGEK